MTTIPERHHAPPLWEATLDVFEAGQQVIIDRIELMRAELSDDMLRLATGVVLVLGAGILALVGYLTLLAALTVLLARVLSPEAALALVGGVHLLVGVVLAFFGARSLRRMHLTMPGRADASHDGGLDG